MMWISLGHGLWTPAHDHEKVSIISSHGLSHVCKTTPCNGPNLRVDMVAMGKTAPFMVFIITCVIVSLAMF
jgi:hypothetical protein